MTLLEAIQEAHEREQLPFNPIISIDDLHRMQDYAREAMVMALNRHVYTIKRKIVIVHKRIHFGKGENQPYGRALVTQAGKICPNYWSRAEMDTLIIDANDGEAEITFKPTPIYPEALSDRIDMPGEYLEEVISGIAMYLRMHRQSKEGGRHGRERA